MLPDVFLPYQQRLWRAVDEHQVTVVEKSRRTGFSWALGAIAAAQAAVVRSGGGSDVLYMGYDAEMTREFIGYVAGWAKSFQVAAGEVQEFVFADPERPERDIKAFRIAFASGAEVIALPSVPRALRGKQGLVILDEAAFMDELEAVLKAAFALLIWGGKVVVCSTHNGDTNPFNALVTDIRSGRAPYHLERLTFDEALAEGLYRRICLTTGKPWSPEAEATWRAEILAIYRDNADEELGVVPNPSSGSWLPSPLIEARSVADVPVLRWSCVQGFAEWAEHLRAAETLDWCREHLLAALQALDPKEPHVFGLDFARKGDLTVKWVLAIGIDMVKRSRLVVELRNCPFSEQQRIVNYCCDRLPKFRGGAMDATGNGMWLAEVTAQKYGELISQEMLSEPWYRAEMPPMKAAFEDAMVTVPQDREVAGDLRAIKMVRGIARVPERTRNDEGLARHGDGGIALALALKAARADPVFYEYRAAVPAQALGAAKRKDWMRCDEEEEDRRARVDGRGMRGAIFSILVLLGAWLCLASCAPAPKIDCGNEETLGLAAFFGGQCT